jgi:hypothetical protein
VKHATIPGARIFLGQALSLPSHVHGPRHHDIDSLPPPMPNLAPRTLHHRRQHWGVCRTGSR